MTSPFILLEANLKTETPLHIGDGRSIGVIKYTRPYLPGSAIRGSIGLLLKRVSCRLTDGEHHAQGEECAYHQLIEDEDGSGHANAIFRYAYPLHIGCGGVFYPTPKTLSICRNPQCNYTINTFTTPLDCPQCGRSLRPPPRYQCSKCQKLVNLPVNTFRSTSTSIDRKTNTAAYFTSPQGEKHGTLHTLELVEAGSQFKLQILISSEAEKQIPVLKNVLEAALKEDGIGAGKSRGLGRLKVSAMKTSEIGPETVKSRSSTVKESEVTLRLLTPTIMEKQQTLRVETILEAARRAYSQIFRSGKPSLNEMKTIAQRYRFITHGGWSLKENRKRIPQSALEPGSMYSFSGADSELKLALSSLEQSHALGGFKTHGCGQVLIC